VSHGIGWVPFASEVNAFKAEIGGEQRVMAARNSKDSAIVADTVQNVFAYTRALPYALDYKFFAERQD